MYVHSNKNFLDKKLIKTESKYQISKKEKQGDIKTYKIFELIRKIDSI